MLPVSSLRSVDSGFDIRISFVIGQSGSDHSSFVIFLP